MNSKNPGSVDIAAPEAGALRRGLRPLGRGRGNRIAMSLPKMTASWNGFWFRRVPPHSLAAFRIIFGAYLLVYFLRFAGDVDVMFSNRGVYVPFLLPDLGLPVFWAWALYGVTIAVIAAFIFGIRTRLLTPVLLALYLYYYCLNLAVNDTAFDRLNLIMLVILCFGELDAAWTVIGHKPCVEASRARDAQPGDKIPHVGGVAQTSPRLRVGAVSRVSKPAGATSRKPTWKSAIQQVWKPALRRGGDDGLQPYKLPAGNLVSIWPIRLVTIQIAFLYFGAGYWKLISPYWHTGEMLRWTLVGPWGTPLAFWLVNLHLPALFFNVLTWSVIALEMSMPILLFSRRLQIYGFAAGLFFHLSIAVLLHIPEFMNCVCAYVLFVKPETVQDWGNALFLRLGGFFTRLADD